jgi:hypothetical protein
MDVLRIAWHRTARWFQPPIATMRRQRLAAGHLGKLPGAGRAIAIARPTEPHALVLEFAHETSAGSP